MHSKTLLAVPLKKKIPRRKTASRAVLLVAVALALLTSVLPAGTQSAALPELNQQLEPLRSQFNADIGKVRLVLLLDPT